MIATPTVGMFAYAHPTNYTDEPSSSDEGSGRELVLVTYVHRHEETPQNPWITVRNAEGVSYSISRERLDGTDLADLDTVALQQAQRIVDEHTRWLTESLNAATERSAASLTRATRAEETIGDIRRYAIDAHRRNDICRDGLDRFLGHFGLDPYDPSYEAWLTVRVKVSGRGVERSDQIPSTVSYGLNVESSDDDFDVLAWEVDDVEDNTVEFTYAA